MSLLLHFGLVNLSFAVVIIPPLVITLANYFIYDLNDDSFYLLYPYTCVSFKMHRSEHRVTKKRLIGTNIFFSLRSDRFPFNWKTPFRFFIALLVQSASLFAILFGITPLMCFLIGTCYLIVTIVEDITNELAPLNADEVLNRHERELTEHLSKIVQLHADAKQLSHIFFQADRYPLIIWTSLSGHWQCPDFFSVRTLVKSDNDVRIMSWNYNSRFK